MPYLYINYSIITFDMLLNVVLIGNFTVITLDPGTILGKSQLIEDRVTVLM